ncbi:MAG: carbohydrate kinase [bacterium]|nr:carbohydrate kinase [bacterium]
MSLLVGIGEVLWDLLPGGKALGGAPANVACHGRALGADAALISAVGADALGREIVARLAELGVPATGIAEIAAQPTGTVAVTLDDQGVPTFVIHEPAAWDCIPLCDDFRALARQADVVCFGSLAQRAPVARATIAALLDETRPDARRVFDINLRQHYYSREIIAASLQRATVLKVNDQELPLLAPLLGLTGPPRAQLETLMHAYALEAVALTRGPHGSLLCVRGAWAEHPGCAVAARDTVGAGDAFTAALSLGLLRGWDAARISDAANRVAAFVCTQHGATPAMPPALRVLFQSASVN